MISHMWVDSSKSGVLGWGLGHRVLVISALPMYVNYPWGITALQLSGAIVVWQFA